MDDVSNNIDDYNPKTETKNLIVFDDTIADIMANNKCQAIIKKPFIRCRNVNTSLVFITQSYFKVPQDVRLNSIHCLMMKIHSTKELQNIAFDHSADIDYKNVLKIYRNCTNEPYSFLTIDITLPADNLTRFRKNFSDFPL